MKKNLTTFLSSIMPKRKVKSAARKLAGIPLCDPATGKTVFFAPNWYPSVPNYEG